MKPIQNLIIMTRCALAVGWRSIAIVVRGFFKTPDRKFINKMIRGGSKSLLHIVKAKYSIQVEKEHPIDNTLPRIYMSNHLSLFDFPLIMVTIPGTTCVFAKHELVHIPLFGSALKQTGQLLIDQQHPEKMGSLYEDAKQKLNSGVSLWIFPEGERSSTGLLLPFKLGGFRVALETGAQIIPVGIKGTLDILPPMKLVPKLNQTLQIRIGKPIDCREYVNQQKKLADKTHEAIKMLLDKAN